MDTAQAEASEKLRHQSGQPAARVRFEDSEDSATAAPNGHGGGDPDPRGRQPQGREPRGSTELGRHKAGVPRRDRPDAHSPLTPPGSPHPSVVVRGRALGEHA